MDADAVAAPVPHGHEIAEALDVFTADCIRGEPIPPAHEAVVFTDGSASRDDDGLLQSGAAAVVLGATQRDIEREAELRVAGCQSSYKAELVDKLQALRSGVAVRSCTSVPIAWLL